MKGFRRQRTSDISNSVNRLPRPPACPGILSIHIAYLPHMQNEDNYLHSPFQSPPAPTPTRTSWGHISTPEKKLVVPTIEKREEKNSRSRHLSSSLPHSADVTQGKSLLPGFSRRGGGILDFKSPSASDIWDPWLCVCGSLCCGFSPAGNGVGRSAFLPLFRTDCLSPPLAVSSSRMGTGF